MASPLKIRVRLNQIEAELGWKGQSVSRYMDETAKQQIYDFNKGGYHVSPALRSPGKGPLVVEMRNLFNAGRISVDPSCKVLVNSLEDGVWSDNSKEDFRRSPALGHLDVLDALAQGCLTLKGLGKWQQNPYPKGVAAHYEVGKAEPTSKPLTKRSTLGYHLSLGIPRMLTSGKK